MWGCGLRPPGAARGRPVDTAHSIIAEYYNVSLDRPFRPTPADRWPTWCRAGSPVGFLFENLRAVSTMLESGGPSESPPSMVASQIYAQGWRATYGPVCQPLAHIGFISHGHPYHILPVYGAVGATMAALIAELVIRVWRLGARPDGRVALLGRLGPSPRDSTEARADLLAQ